MSVENVTYADDIESYVETHLAPAEEALTHAYENSIKNGIPAIAISPIQGKFLGLLTKISSSKNVLEIGTLGGYSSIWFARALKERGGKVTSIEVDSKHREVAIQNLQHAGIEVPDEVEVHLGAALDVLPKLADEIKAGHREKFDFVFIDADWNNQWRYFDWAVQLCKGKGSVIYVDNVVRMILESGIVGPETKDKSAIPLVEKVAADERVEAVTMQTVGRKDYDGFLMAVVK